MRESFAKLTGKYARALARSDQSTVERVDRLRAMLLPNDEPQERVHGLSYYACRFGDAFVRSVVDAVEPFAAAIASGLRLSPYRSVARQSAVVPAESGAVPMYGGIDPANEPRERRIHEHQRGDSHDMKPDSARIEPSSA